VLQEHRRSAANASSVTSRADEQGSTETCYLSYQSPENQMMMMMMMMILLVWQPIGGISYKVQCKLQKKEK